MQTRECLLEAAQRLFVQRGFGGASIREIAEEAGYSQGAFYSNFPDKEVVLLEILSRHKTREMQQLSATLDVAENTDDDILSGLEAWISNLDQDANWSMLAVELQLHAKRNLAFAVEYEAMWQENRVELSRLIDRLFRRMGLTPQADSADLAAGFMALGYGLALQRMTGKPDKSGHLMMVFIRSVISDARQQQKHK